MAHQHTCMDCGRPVSYQQFPDCDFDIDHDDGRCIPCADEDRRSRPENYEDDEEEVR